MFDNSVPVAQHDTHVIDYALDNNIRTTIDSDNPSSSCQYNRCVCSIASRNVSNAVVLDVPNAVLFCSVFVLTVFCLLLLCAYFQKVGQPPPCTRANISRCRPLSISTIEDPDWIIIAYLIGHCRSQYRPAVHGNREADPTDARRHRQTTPAERRRTSHCASPTSVYTQYITDFKCFPCTVFGKNYSDLYSSKLTATKHKQSRKEKWGQNWKRINNKSLFIY